MSETLTLATANFEGVYGWLEQQADAQVEVWGLEHGRRAALIAHRGTPPDDFGWANWVRGLYDDPSEICPAFEQLEVAMAGDGNALKAAFPGVFAVTTAGGGWHGGPAAPGQTSVPTT